MERQMKRVNEEARKPGRRRSGGARHPDILLSAPAPSLLSFPAFLASSLVFFSSALFRVFRGPVRSELLEELEELAVEGVAVPVLVVDVLALGIEDTEGAAEVPERVADAVGGEDFEHVAEPGEDDVVRGVAEGSALAAVDADALAGQLGPRLVECFEALTIPRLTPVEGAGPGGRERRSWSPSG